MALTITLAIISFLSFGITAAALVYALRQTGQLQTMHKSLIKQTDDLGTILESAATRYLGEFPHFMDKVIDLILSAKEEIVILIDVPAYAMFSAPEFFIEYKQAIEKTIFKRKVKVRMLFLSPEVRAEMHDRQFADAIKNWEKWRNDDKNFQKLRSYLDTYDPELRPEEITLGEFFDSVIGENQKMADLLRQSIKGNAMVTSEQVMTYFWVIDGKQAVFAFPDFDENALETGFITSDSKLIRQLLKRFEYYAGNAHKPLAPAPLFQHHDKNFSYRNN